jgi:transcriptional regulator with XRE-family HTH domain
MWGIVVDAKRLKQLRQARGLTQLELAVLAGVAERTVRNAEIGRRIRPDFVKFIAIALEVEITDLAGEPVELRIARREQRNADLVLEALAAVAGERDFSVLRSLLAPNILVRIPGPSQIPFAGEFRGFDRVQTCFDLCEQAVTYERPPELTEIRSSGNFVVISGTDCIRAMPTRKIYSGSWMHICEYDKGRLVRLDEFPATDPTSMRALAEAYTENRREKVSVQGA